MFKLKRVLTMMLIISLIIVCVSCINKEGTINYSSHQYKEFIENILEAYSYSNQEAKVVELSDERAVLKVDNGLSRYILFDLKNERVLSSDYKYTEKKGLLKLSNSSKSEQTQYDYSYNENGNVTAIKSSNTNYKYTYNELNKITQKWQNDCLLEERYYDSGVLSNINYSNDYSINYIMNGQKCIEEVYGNDDLLYEMKYNKDNTLMSYYDTISNRIYKYDYYDLEHFRKILVDDDFEINYSNEENPDVEYCYKGKEVSAYKIKDSLYTSNYNPIVQYDIADRPRLASLKFASFDYQTKYEYVVYEPTLEELTDENYEDYIYDITSDAKISKLSNNIYDMCYKYNELGMITDYSYGDQVYKYEYDENGQLVSYSLNGEKSIIGYDIYGNITSFNGNVYVYDSVGNLNRLSKLNGKSIEYDNMGNPLNYNGTALSWNGRRLKSYDDLVFNYDKYGNRIQKYNSESLTNYYYDNSKLVYEINDNYIISYMYLNDTIIGLNYNNKDYYYIKNAQEDVLAIVDTNGNVVVSYVYDPFGNVLEISGPLKDSLGYNNPIRFKSYYYDKESDLYFLQSRYYDSNIGRFISQDDTIYLQGTYLLNNISKNLYAYCMNDPVNKIDETGHSARWVIATVKFLFADIDIISDDKLGATMLVLNGANVYNAFHETAQILAADQLQNKGYICSLEVSCNKLNGQKGEIDILANDKYVYEVKNYFDSYSSAVSQVMNYVNANQHLGYRVGIASFDSKIVNFLGNKIKMRVQYEGQGVIKYSFSLDYSFRFLWKNVQVKREITEEKMKKAVSIATWAGIAVAGLIIVATIVEDVVTYGAGVADDAQSISIAASTYSGIVSGMVMCMV